ncbi:restriction endonuclease subunit S [Aliarcobacter cryaerophilus]|uniref:restriction endonuclease subunit S n=1 Tax=Aliarcobacter cryaerophilus TaxID=28198 RepID=UPI003DA4C67B
MSKLSLKDIFYKPISGEWGNEPADDYVEIIKTNNILNFGKIDFSNTTLREVETKKVEIKKLEYGDILVEKSGGSPANPVGRVCFFNKNEGTYLTNNFMSTLRLKNSNFDSKYVFYYLFDLYRKKVVLNFQNQTTGIINFKLDRYLDEITISQIDLGKQKQIAKTLDKANELIELRKESITKLDVLAKSIFIDMFGNPVSNPKGWEINKFEKYIDYIGDIGSNGSNAVISKNLKMSDKKDFALMIRTTNLNKNDFYNDVKYVSEETYNFFKKSKIYGGEIIMNKIGSAGKFWIMPKLNVPVSLGLNQLMIKLKDLNTKFLYYFLSTDYGQVMIASKTNGAVTKSITKGAVKDFDIAVPPIDLQNKFAKIIEKIEEQKSLYEKELEKLQINFDALLQKSF